MIKNKDAYKAARQFVDAGYDVIANLFLRKAYGR
jgi:hypothetical protein